MNLEIAVWKNDKKTWTIKNKIKSFDKNYAHIRNKNKLVVDELLIWYILFTSYK